MRNQTAAVARRLSDPDFQGTLVNRCLALTLGMGVAARRRRCSMTPGFGPIRFQPRYFFTDGKHAPRPVVALDSPIVDDTELLEWSGQGDPRALQRRLLQLPGGAEYGEPALYGARLEHFRQLLHLAGQFRRAEARAAAVPRAVAARGGDPSDELRARRARLPIQVPITQTCENVNQTSSNNLMITALVIRTNDDDHPDGLAIDQLVAAPR